ncbi:hypothetical protein Goari_026765 [Gossypium aridum]|uniref:Uncharacterized protein n=1 Tax=Gossypium aridum TaxID=34290 RepID=A0A7J8YTJ0_GOSAI|nr:hypothetical protein [Gossypium aridum]
MDRKYMSPTFLLDAPFF